MAMWCGVVALMTHLQGRNGEGRQEAGRRGQGFGGGVREGGLQEGGGVTGRFGEEVEPLSLLLRHFLHGIAILGARHGRPIARRALKRALGLVEPGQEGGLRDIIPVLIGRAPGGRLLGLAAASPSAVFGGSQVELHLRFDLARPAPPPRAAHQRRRAGERVLFRRGRGSGRGDAEVRRRLGLHRRNGGFNQDPGLLLLLHKHLS